MAQRRAAEAVEPNRRAIALDDSIVGAHFNLGLAMVMLDSPRGALPQPAPSRAAPAGLAAAYAEAGRFNEAVRTIDQALAVSRSAELRGRREALPETATLSVGA